MTTSYATHMPAGDAAVQSPAERARVRRTGLWVFMGVVTMLFFLFSVAYVMRMAASDWRVLPAPPWQLWASTALLAGSSLAWASAARGGSAGASALRADGTISLAAARAASRATARGGAEVQAASAASNQAGGAMLAVAVLLSLAFIGMQLWAWEAMRAMNYPLAANPANSFFYMITGLHGLHVLGGLVAAAFVWRARDKLAVSLCARYWHFLLALWLAMFGLLFLMTPERVDIICNSFQ